MTYITDTKSILYFHNLQVELPVLPPTYQESSGLPPYQDAFQVLKSYKTHEQQEVGQRIMREEKH